MSHTGEPASTKPPPGPRAKVRRRDAILDAMHRYHRAVGAVVATTAALSLNGALLSGFDTVARRATQTELAVQNSMQGVRDTQQSAMQKREVRMVELPPVQIVGRRLPPDAEAFAPLIADGAASSRNAGQGLTASRTGLLSNFTQERKPMMPNWESTQP